MAFQCTVATPEGVLFDGTVTSATVPAHDGLIGILTDRAPILLKLGAGKLTLQTAGTAGEVVFFVAGGVAQMKDNVLTILTDEATTPGKLDAEAARRDVAELSNFTITTPTESASRERKLNRARAVIRTVESAA